MDGVHGTTKHVEGGGNGAKTRNRKHTTEVQLENGSSKGAEAGSEVDGEQKAVFLIGLSMLSSSSISVPPFVLGAEELWESKPHLSLVKLTIMITLVCPLVSRSHRHALSMGLFMLLAQPSSTTTLEKPRKPTTLI